MLLPLAFLLLCESLTLKNNAATTTLNCWEGIVQVIMSSAWFPPAGMMLWTRELLF